MLNLRNSPFLWISLMLLISYWISGTLSISGLGIKIILSSICIISSVISILRFSPGKQYLSSILIGILIFSAGMLRSHDFKKKLYHGKLLSASEFQQGIFKVNQVLKNKGSSVSLSCSRITLFNNEIDSQTTILDKNILIYVKTESPLSLLPGDIIRAEGWLSAIKGPLNPNAFDARRYYNTLGIRHQIFCKAEDVSIEGSIHLSIARMTASWQMLLSTIVRTYTTPQVAQLTNALVWGDRSDMDTELRDAFADSGAMHVLSVSGMHVAIIYSMLFFILGSPGSGTFLLRIIRFGLYTTAIVLYMGLTGGCPAVIRAGLMIILFLLGKSMGWNTQIWNLMGFAAFLMLWINPHIWQNIGFQLSFLAMAGILLFAKPLIRCVSFKNTVLNKCWEVTSLSIVAQIFILPILLRQFHQFPLTFILSSIAAVPAAYIVILGALVNITFSFIGIGFLWPALEWSGRLFIDVMQWMSGLNPLMYFSLPSLGSLFLMMMAVLFSFSLVFKWTAGRKIAWVCGIATFATLSCHRITQWANADLTVYHSPKGLLIDIIENGKCYSVFDCSLPPASIEFITRGYRCERDIINVESICQNHDFDKNNIRYKESLISLANKQIQIWNTSDDFIASDISYLIVNDCSGMDFLKACSIENPNLLIILPAHLARNCRKHLVAFYSEHNIACHDIDLNGFYKIRL